MKINSNLSKHLATAVLVCISLLGLVVRLYRLDQAPAGALVDEMHFGYIVHSLLETGADEHGNRWPLVFTAFGDYKLPGYAYLLLPFVALFDMTVFSIRLPSVLLGTVNIFLIYFLSRSYKLPTVASLLAVATMAFSPWPFILSRFGFESNLGLTLWLVGLLFLNNLQESSSQLRKAITGFTIGLTWYTYIAYRPVSIVILLLYLGFCLLQKKLSFKTVGIIITVFLITITPMLLPGVGAANTARFNQISIFADAGIVMTIDERRTYCSWQTSRLWCDLIWNKPVVITSVVINRYIKLFSPEYLAVEGEADAEYLTVTGFGAFPYVVYPFFILGILYILLGKINKLPQVSTQHRFLLLLGLFLSGVPTILSGQPQRVRLSVALPFFIMAIAYGSLLLEPIVATVSKFFIESVRYEKLKKYILGTILVVMGGIFIFNTLQYLTDYYFVYTAKKGYEYGSYIRELMPYLKRFEGTHQIYIKPYFAAPIMYYAFYTNYNPKLYQETAVLGVRESAGFQHTIGLGKVEVTEKLMQSYACNAVATNQATLFVTNVLDQGGFPPQNVVRSSNGVDVQAYVYDVLLYGKKFVDTCENISPAEKIRIKKEYEADLLSPL